MELTSLSWTPNRPCLLLKMPNLQVLLDCALSMDSLASFLPCPIVRSNRISWQKKVHPYGKGVIPVLKQINDFVYAELVPEVRTVMVKDLNLELVDAILVSGTSSLICLPFLTEGTEFRGTVYATDPTLQLGKLLMEDLCDMFERVDRPTEDNWAWKSLCRSFPNAPNSDPFQWRQFYTREAMQSALAKVQLVFFREEIVINGELHITAQSSGHAIGSCNWLLQTERQKIGYFASSSLRHSHTKPMDLSAFASLDSLILSSLSTVDQGPDVTVYKFSSAVVDTLKANGNVLIPVVPTGLVYDLFECVLKTIEANNLSRNIPIYFVSTVAESSLQFAQIFPEWLSEEKASRVYKPEEPFYHSELVRSGRLRVYDSLHGAFSRECRQPCVVFCGHPSLRIGEVVHLLDLWGGNSRNSIMMIDPDYPLEVYYSPYRTLAIRAYYFPIETRLDSTQVLNKVIGELSPRYVLYSEEHSASLSGTLGPLPHVRATSFRQGECVRLEDVAEEQGQQPHKRVKIDTELLTQMETDGGLLGLCPISGLLSIYDNNLELKPVHLSAQPNQRADKKAQHRKRKPPANLPLVSEEPATKIAKASAELFHGKVSATALLEELKKRKLDAEEAETGERTTIINIPSLCARVRLLEAGKRTLISCPSEVHRKTIQTAVQACLSRFRAPAATANQPVE